MLMSILKIKLEMDGQPFTTEDISAQLLSSMKNERKFCEITFTTPSILISRFGEPLYRYGKNGVFFCRFLNAAGKSFEIHSNRYKLPDWKSGKPLPFLITSNGTTNEVQEFCKWIESLTRTEAN